MAEVTIYSGDSCSYCRQAKALLDSKGVSYTENKMMLFNIFARRRIARLTGGHTVPQIVIDGEPIGGWDELSALDKAGELDAKLGV